MKRLLTVGAIAFAELLAAQDGKPIRPVGNGAPRGAATGGATAKPAPKPAPVARTAAPATAPARMQNVQIDPNTGWPIGGDEPEARPAPATETAPAARPSRGTAKDDKTRPNGAAAASADAKARADGQQPLVSGTQLGSPLLDVYQALQGPGAWRQIGGVVVWWRVTIYGADGEPIGAREVTHTADTAFVERDRLEYADGRTFGRVGAQVAAERAGMPMPTLTEAAERELMLFGVQLRMPWLFGDANAFTVIAKEVDDGSGERLRKIVLEQRPTAQVDVVGPELDPKPRDRFELLYEPSTGVPRQLVHRFACSLQTRRVLLEDWREFDGIPMKLPARRVYVDESMRPTTVLEILRMVPQRVNERDFRLF